MPKPEGKGTKELTTDELLELICDIAYQQSTREISGSYWFNEFIKKIDEMQHYTQPKQG